MRKIIILSLYPNGLVPGPRFRYEQYLDVLRNKFNVKQLSFFNSKAYRRVHANSNTLHLLFSIIKGYFKTGIHIVKCINADFVFIYRDVTPFGPPLAEWIIAEVLRKKIIYDFDDAVWLTDLSAKERLKTWLRNPGKTNQIISWSYKVSCGNAYLCDHAKLFNTHVILNPTTIDTHSYHNQLKDQHTKQVVVGWTGTHSTLKYLDPIIPVIEKLQREIDFTFMVICNKDPGYKLTSYVFRTWNKESEIRDLLEFNFGLMPLPNDDWSKGKCGFKALQYMALGMPAVVSPVGVNLDIVQHDINGFVCVNDKDWEEYIRLLVLNPEERLRLGITARKTIENKYSVNSNTNNFISLFE